MPNLQSIKEEPIVYSKENREFFLTHLNKVINACLDFKESPPVKLNSNGKFLVDIDKIFEKSQILVQGNSLESVIDDFSKYILDQSLNFSSPSFLAHPDNGSGIASIIGDVARGLMQQNLVSYEYSPAATYVEYTLLQQIRTIIGYQIFHTKDFSVEQKQSGFFDNYIFGQSLDKKLGDEFGDFSVDLAGGAFVFGGTNANFTGLLAAREKLKKKISRKGGIYDPRKVRILTKVPFAHYSMRRSASLLGLGNNDLTTEQLKDMRLSQDMRVNIQTQNYKIDIYDLEIKINKVLNDGEEILSIFAVAGDSRMVSFDNLRAITQIAEKYDVWVHADGCEGGQCLFSPNRKHLWDGVENVNSLSLDPHKVLMVPYNLSLFMLRDIEDMRLIDIGTSLVRLGSLSHGTFTPGIGTKDFASLRLWFLLKHIGWERLAKEIDHRHELALGTAELIKYIPELMLINQDIEHNAVAFAFCPLNYFQSDVFSLVEINTINKEIHNRLNGQTGYYLHMMSTQDDNCVLSKDRMDVTILRAMYGNPLTSIEIIENCLREVVRLGREIFNEKGITVQ